MPGDELLVAQQVLQLPVVLGDARTPHVERQRRIVRVRSLLVPAGDRPRRRRRASGRSCPCASRRGSASRSPRPPPAATRHPRPSRPPDARAPAAQPRLRTSNIAATLRPRLRARRGKAQPAGEHRVDDDPVARELEDKELAAPHRRSSSTWPLNAASSAGVPRSTSDWGVVAPVSGRPARPRRVRRRGSPGRVVRARARS